MKANITYEQALAKASPILRRRMEYSVNLLQKAESLAFKYDENGFFLAFSCGKDSQCLYHIAELAGVKFKAHFSATSCDPPQVIKFCKTQYPEVDIIKPTISIYDMAVQKGILPMRIVRWCCKVYKEGHGAGRVVLTGVRKAESVNRSRRESVEVTRMKFRGDWDGFSQFRENTIANKKSNRYDAKEMEVRCISGKDRIIVNPIVYWEDCEVWEFLNKVVEVPHLELYDPPYNKHRVGCVLCPMLSYKAALRDCELFPHVKERWIKAITKLRENGKYTNHNWGGHNEREEAELIFDQWISGKTFDEWYAKKYPKVQYVSPSLFDEANNE